MNYDWYGYWKTNLIKKLGKSKYLLSSSYFFLNQQFITWYVVVDHGSYFVTTYNRSKLHEEMETEEREREKRYKELIEEIEKKGKRNREIREF